MAMISGEVAEEATPAHLLHLHGLLLAPVVFAPVNARKRKATVAEAMHQDAWMRHIIGPLSMQVLIEFDRLCDILEGVQLTAQLDTFAWRLTADQNYSAASAYGPCSSDCRNLLE
jgi:hypothetical protein